MNFYTWGMAAGKMEVLLVVGGFDVDGGAEARLVNKDVNIREGEMVKVKSFIPFLQAICGRRICNHPSDSPASPPISPLPLPPVVTLSPFSNVRFITMLHPPYPKPNPFVP